MKSGLPSRYAEFVEAGGAGYDVEHIWANHHERFEDELPQEKEFDHNRNRIGGLVLLPSSVNRHLSDRTFADKRDAYAEECPSLNDESPRNLLVRSLVTRPADIPGFGEFVAKSGLPFEPCEEFRKADLEAREKLYGKLGRRIWSMEAIREAANAQAAAGARNVWTGVVGQ